jgi:hypothetical protein
LRASLASEPLPAVVVGRILLIDDYDVVAGRDGHVARRDRYTVADGRYECSTIGRCTDQRREQRA